jgi:hypothetical protein
MGKGAPTDFVARAPAVSPFPPSQFEDALRLAKACGPSLAGAASSALVVPKEEERERK